MRFLLLAVVTILTVFQGGSGTFLGNVNNGHMDLQSSFVTLSQEVRELAKEMKTAISEYSRESRLKLEASVDNALFLVKMHPEKCTRGVESQLVQLKSSKVASFFKCANLTLAIEEIGTIVFETLSLTGDIGLVVNDLLQLAASCKTVNPFSFIKCWFSKMDNIKNDLEAAIDAIKKYGGDMKTLAHEIKANIDTCFAPHKVTLEREVKGVMDRVRKCSQNVQGTLRGQNLHLLL